MPLFGGPPDIKKLQAKNDIPGLIKALEYQKDYAVPWHAAEALGVIGDPVAVEPLIAAISRDARNTYSLRAAVVALGQIGDARAVETLISRLGDLDWDVRSHAAGALAQIGAPAVEPLIDSLGHFNKAVRELAAWALGRIGDPRAVEPLIAATADQERGVCTAALEALDKLAWKPGRTEAGAVYWITKGDWDECAKIGASAVKPLVFLLGGSDEDARQGAVGALAKIGDPAVKPLIAILGDEDEAAGAAAETLAKIGSPAVKPLIAALGDEDEAMRVAVIDTLAKLGDASAIDPLIAALGDQHEDVRMAAVRALEELAWKPGRTEAGAVYWITKGNWDECANIGGPAVGPLMGILRGRDKDAQKAAATALAAIGQPAVAALATTLDTSDPAIRAATVSALTRIGSPAVAPLVSALRSENTLLRGDAARSLATIGDPAAAAPLAAALEDADRGVRRLSAQALGRLGGAAAVEPLVAVLERNDKWTLDDAKIAAEALVAIYQSGKLDAASKARLLAHRAAIVGQHVDEMFTPLCIRNEPGEGHRDAAFNVEFPI
jgi:HEAT repeat protein